MTRPWTRPSRPPASPTALRALWWLRKGGLAMGPEWDIAHTICQAAEGTPPATGYMRWPTGSRATAATRTIGTAAPGARRGRDIERTGLGRWRTSPAEASVGQPQEPATLREAGATMATRAPASVLAGPGSIRLHFGEPVIRRGSNRIPIQHRRPCAYLLIT